MKSFPEEKSTIAFLRAGHVPKTIYMLGCFSLNVLWQGFFSSFSINLWIKYWYF